MPKCGCLCWSNAMVSVILPTYENAVLGLVMIDLNYEYQLVIPFFSRWRVITGTIIDPNFSQGNSHFFTPRHVPTHHTVFGCASPNYFDTPPYTTKYPTAMVSVLTFPKLTSTSELLTGD